MLPGEPCEWEALLGYNSQAPRGHFTSSHPYHNMGGLALMRLICTASGSRTKAASEVIVAIVILKTETDGNLF